MTEKEMIQVIEKKYTGRKLMLAHEFSACFLIILSSIFSGWIFLVDRVFSHLFCQLNSQGWWNNRWQF